MTSRVDEDPLEQPDEPFDYATILTRLVPPEVMRIDGPVYEPLDFLRERFGDPEQAAVSPTISDLTFRKGDAGIKVRVDTASAAAFQISAMQSLAFGLPFLWKSCPQSRWSGAWVTGTGQATYTVILGSVAQALGQAAGLALLDYAQQVAAQKPALCQGLCTAPCWCTVDAKFPTRNTTITTSRRLFGLPVSFTVTITLSGWVIASCEGWNL